MKNIIKRRREGKKLESLANLAKLGVKVEGLTPDGVTTKRFEKNVLKDLYREAIVLSAGLFHTKQELVHRQSAVMRSIPTISFQDFSGNMYFPNVTEVLMNDELVGYLIRTEDYSKSYLCTRWRIRVANKEVITPARFDELTKEEAIEITFCGLSHLLGLAIQHNGIIYNEDDWGRTYDRMTYFYDKPEYTGY